MPNGHSPVVREIDLCLDRQEAVDLALRGPFGGEVVDVHGSCGGTGVHGLIFIHQVVSFIIIPKLISNTPK